MLSLIDHGARSQPGWLMPNKFIYVFEGDQLDYSRWLHITAFGNECTLHLSDLCHPGQVSNLAKVIFPLDYVRSAAQGGAIQTTVDDGYFLARREEGLMLIEFRSSKDAATCKTSVKADEFDQRIQDLSLQVTQTA
jgi:hypothetical protein